MRIGVISALIILTITLSLWNFFPRKSLGQAGLQVFSKPDGAQVLLDEVPVGVTPYQTQGLKPAEIKLTIGTGAASFAKLVKLSPQVFTIVNRELANNQFLQAGEILSLESGTGLLILSTPEGAEVEVGEQKVGKTPVKLDKVAAGSHKVVIAKENFISRSVQIQVHPNYRLILDVTLSSTPENLAKILGPTYATASATFFPKVKISPTPTGFLRVRNNPSLAANEITTVTPGEEFPLLEEKPNWFKIRLTDGREGWISSQYAQKN